MTAPLRSPAMAYWAIMRMRALAFPLLKSDISSPFALTATTIASVDSLMLMVRLTSGLIKDSAAWASVSSACTP